VGKRKHDQDVASMIRRFNKLVPSRGCAAETKLGRHTMVLVTDRKGDRTWMGVLSFEAELKKEETHGNRT